MASATPPFPVYGGDARGAKSIAFGTVITRIIPPRLNAYTRLMAFSYLSAGTAHTLTCMRSLGRTTTLDSTAASQKVVNLVADPGPTGNLIAANDWLVFEYPDGTYHADLVASVATLAITMTVNFPAVLAAGAHVWNFGITTNTDPITGEAHQAWTSIVSDTLTVSNDVVGIARSNGKHEPLLLYSNNATATGSWISCHWLHTTK